MASEAHSLWFPNAPYTATATNVADQIFGGPLESLRWFEHYNDHGFSFLINFLDHKTAAAFLAYSKSPACQMHFPDNREDWRPFITWSENINTIRPHVRRAACDPLFPATRVLVIQNFPAEFVSKLELKERLIALELQFQVHHWIDTYKIYPSPPLAYIVFSRIGSAMRVMQWHQDGLFGPEFDNSEVTYGRDPSDYPIPETGDDSTPPYPSPEPGSPPKRSHQETNIVTTGHHSLPQVPQLGYAIIPQAAATTTLTPPLKLPAAPLATTLVAPRPKPSFLIDFADTPSFGVPNSPASPPNSSISSVYSSVCPSETAEGSSDVSLSPARLAEMANFSDLFFAQEDSA